MRSNPGAVNLISHFSGQNGGRKTVFTRMPSRESPSLLEPYHIQHHAIGKCMEAMLDI